MDLAANEKAVHSDFFNGKCLWRLTTPPTNVFFPNVDNVSLKILLAHKSPGLCLVRAQSSAEVNHESCLIWQVSRVSTIFFDLHHDWNWNDQSYMAWTEITKYARVILMIVSNGEMWSEERNAPKCLVTSVGGQLKQAKHDLFPSVQLLCYPRL